MAARNFGALIQAQWKARKFVCVGLDTLFERIPEHLQSLGVRGGLVRFNQEIIDATKDVACAYKPNSAFYERHGDLGFSVLQETIEYIRERAPEIPVIDDCKRGDTADTNVQYAASVFDVLRADALTVHPTMGSESLRPFFDRTEKGVFVLCRTSNTGSGEMQDLMTGGIAWYERLAQTVNDTWNTGGNCGLVTGATYPAEIRAIRTHAPQLPLLIPGIGAQGGNLEETVAAARTPVGGMIINSSRSILYASAGADFAEEARRAAHKLHAAIEKALE